MVNNSLKEGQINSVICDMCEKELDSILNDIEDLDLYEDEKKILKLQEYNIYNIYEEGNVERTMTVDFEKYIIRASEMLGGVDVGSYTEHQFMSMN
jgi:hypothetical protein